MEQNGALITAEGVLRGRNLLGKRVLVTGVSSGVGAETARVLALHGAAVVGAARDPAKAAAVTHGLTGDVSLIQLDLVSLRSVRACADALLAIAKPFDAIIAYASVMAVSFALTEDGLETHLAVNHLGHVVLVNRLAMLLLHRAKPKLPSRGKVIVCRPVGAARSALQIARARLGRRRQEEGLMNKLIATMLAGTVVVSMTATAPAQTNAQTKVETHSKEKGGVATTKRTVTHTVRHKTRRPKKILGVKVGHKTVTRKTVRQTTMSTNGDSSTTVKTSH